MKEIAKGTVCCKKGTHCFQFECSHSTRATSTDRTCDGFHVDRDNHDDLFDEEGPPNKFRDFSDDFRDEEYTEVERTSTTRTEKITRGECIAGLTCLPFSAQCFWTVLYSSLIC